MALAERYADSVWEGNLPKGKGTVSGGSGALGQLAVTWAARTESPGGKTSPEELIAAAQASCYAMAFSNTLDKAGHPPQQLNVHAVCTLERKPEGGVKVSSMTIDVRGQVPGLDAAEFERLAQEAERGCPVANALRNNVTLQVSAHLL